MIRINFLKGNNHMKKPPRGRLQESRYEVSGDLEVASSEEAGLSSTLSK